MHAKLEALVVLASEDDVEAYTDALIDAAPGMLETIRNLRAMLLSVGVNGHLLDMTIAQSMKGLDPVG
jgi:hypothetical protein